MSTNWWLTSSQGRLRVIAHRGDSFRAPENTLEAARRGHEAGADAWELDVQVTRDGVAVVFHDDSLERTTDVVAKFADDPRRASGFRLEDFTRDELQALDTGSWFLSPRGLPRSAMAFGSTGLLSPEARAQFASGLIRIPTLVEALALTRERDWFVNVEMKSVPGGDDRLVDLVLGAIEETGTAARVLVSSFDHEHVARVAASGRGLATAILSLTPIHDPGRYARDAVGADFYHPSAIAVGAESIRYREAPSTETLRWPDPRRLRDHRVATSVFTVNDFSAGGLAEHVFRAGAWGVFTDDPASGVAFARHNGH